MPHLRERVLKPLFLKELKFWPAVSLMGPRQCGKSTFLREMVWKSDTFTYRSLDRAAERDRAEANPESFLASISTHPCVIDEAHKAPSLFDEIKAEIDERRRPGRYILTGSVRFSSKVGVRESLTGRTSLLRMDTMGLRETLAREPPSLRSVQKYLEVGGMPGVCFARDRSTRTNYWESWLDTILERDLRLFSKGRLSADLARRVLETLTKIELPEIAQVARILRTDARRVQTHVSAMMDLFLLREVSPHPASGAGKNLYFAFDAGLGTYLGANLRRQWQIWMLTEASLLGQRREIPRADLHYYRSRRGSFVDLVVGSRMHLFTELPAPDRGDLMTAEAALKAVKPSKFVIHCATDQGHHRQNKMLIAPWSKFHDALVE